MKIEITLPAPKVEFELNFAVVCTSRGSNEPLALFKYQGDANAFIRIHSYPDNYKIVEV